MVVGGRGLGVAVVFGHKDDRQFPDGGQVEALVQGALLGRAVAKKADRDLIGLVGLGGQTRAAGQRRTAANNAVGAQHALVHIRDMH